MGVVDLDAARKARREANDEGPEVKFGGKTYQLAPEVPFAILESIRDLMDAQKADEGLIKLSKALLGKHWTAFRKTEPSVEDVSELIAGVLQEYGISSPLTSSASSKSTTTR